MIEPELAARLVRVEVGAAMFCGIATLVAGFMIAMYHKTSIHSTQLAVLESTMRGVWKVLSEIKVMLQAKEA